MYTFIIKKKKFNGRLWVAGLIALPILLFYSGLHAEERNTWTKEKKVLVTNIAGIAAITGWGIAKWDYFQNTPKIDQEGWFSESTKEGGADKLAHFYSSYILSHALSGTFNHWGYSKDKAAFLGSFSSFTITASMELADSFSDYGFSYEDLIMNTLGSALGYLLYVDSDLSDKIDFRIEYIPEFKQSDFFTDYDHMKFLMAMKLEGFKSIRKTWAKYIELHLGYDVKGYSNQERAKERNISIGIGLNLSRIFKEFSMKKTSKLFNYYQLPYTYISTDKNLNEN